MAHPIPNPYPNSHPLTPRQATQYDGHNASFGYWWVLALIFLLLSIPTFGCLYFLFRKRRAKTRSRSALESLDVEMDAVREKSDADDNMQDATYISRPPRVMERRYWREGGEQVQEEHYVLRDMVAE